MVEGEHPRDKVVRTPTGATASELTLLVIGERHSERF